MIRHTAAEALFANAFSIDGKSRKTAAARRKRARRLADDGSNRASIVALIKIACNASSSPNLRATACDCLGERIALSPELAAFAARELFAKRETGAPSEFVFDALLYVIREAPRPTGTLFHDAVDALCEGRKSFRAAAAKRMIRALDRPQLPAPAVISLNVPFFIPGNAARHA